MRCFLLRSSSVRLSNSLLQQKTYSSRLCFTVVLLSVSTSLFSVLPVRADSEERSGEHSEGDHAERVPAVDGVRSSASTRSWGDE